jgi:hypothetical protein
MVFVYIYPLNILFFRIKPCGPWGRDNLQTPVFGVISQIRYIYFMYLAERGGDGREKLQSREAYKPGPRTNHSNYSIVSISLPTFIPRKERKIRRVR